MKTKDGQSVWNDIDVDTDKRGEWRAEEKNGGRAKREKAAGTAGAAWREDRRKGTARRNHRRW